MFFETVEPRLCLSATLDAATGVLTVTGTAENDRIVVRKGANNTIAVIESVVSARPAQRGDRPLTPTEITRTTFPRGDVTAVVVNAGDGDDHVTLGWKVLVRRRGIRLHALEIPATLNGGAGNDFLRSGHGPDSLNGGGGNDFLTALGGNDTLNGDAGNDHLDAGRGADLLSGGAGNDRLVALDATGTDTLDGGDNDPVTTTNPGDVAILDAGDVVTSVEKTRIREAQPA